MEQQGEVEKTIKLDYGALRKLQCPFTWDMKEILQKKTKDKDFKPRDEEDHLLILKLVRYAVQVFEAVSTKDFEKAKKDIEESEKILESATKECLEDLQISRRAVKHIILATKCWLLIELKDEEKLKETLKEINDLKCNREDENTFVGLKSTAWCTYHILATEKTVHFVKKALEEKPNCAVWHFILGKTKRRQRRDASVKMKIDREEINSLKTAYKLSDNVLFHLYYAQSLRDAGKRHEALEEYVKISQKETNSAGIKMRLALGFMTFRNFELAEEYLDSIEDECGSFSMYLHYRAILLDKKKQYQEAAVYYKRAAEQNNFPADTSYALCQEKVDKNFNVLEHFMGMLKKYENIVSNDKKQELLLNIASYYVHKVNDLDRALEYYLKGLSIAPNSNAVNHYTHIFTANRAKIYVFISKEILPLIIKNRNSYKPETQKICQELRLLCDQHFKKLQADTLKGFSKMSV